MDCTQDFFRADLQYSRKSSLQKSTEQEKSMRERGRGKENLRDAMPVIISVLYSALFRVQVLELKQHKKKNIKSREIKEEHKIYLQLNFFSTEFATDFLLNAVEILMNC